MAGHVPPDDIDTGALGAWLAPRVDTLRLPLAATKFASGQSNPTYALSDAAGRRFVLRKKPKGVLLPSAHAVEREHRVMSALASSGVPVPRMLGLCEDANVIGTPFFVMEHVEGRIFWDPALPELARADRGALHDDVNRVVASLHDVDPVAVGLGDFGRPAGFMPRQIDRWTRQYRASETERLPAMEALIAWLPAHLPVESPVRIFHGDLRIDNLIVHPSEPRVVAVLDWELSTLGDPLADLAYHVLPWRLKADEFRGMAGRDLEALGVPGETDYVRRYLDRTGRRVEAATWEFYIAYSLFRLAAILQGIRKRHLDGTASSTEAAATGSRTPRVAAVGAALIERLDP